MEMQACVVFVTIFLAGVAGLPSNVDIMQGQSRAPLRIRGGGRALVTKEQLFDITAGLGLVQVESKELKIPSNPNFNCFESWLLKTSLFDIFDAFRVLYLQRNQSR